MKRKKFSRNDGNLLSIHGWWVLHRTGSQFVIYVTFQLLHLHTHTHTYTHTGTIRFRVKVVNLDFDILTAVSALTCALGSAWVCLILDPD